MVSKSRHAAATIRLLFTLVTLAAGLVAGQASGGQLTASWVDNSNGTATTRLERRLGTGVTFTAIADVPPGATGYVDGSVSPGTTYCYRALAYDAAGVSPYSDEACATSAVDATPLTVTVSKAGNGAGTVASTPVGILCGTTCSGTYPAGSSVTLAATPATGSTFTGWSGGGCSGTATCIIAGNAPVSVSATFSLVTATYTLSVSVLGPGAVSSVPSGISCGSVCSAAYFPGTQVTLTAKTNGNSATFSGWTGGCSGSSMTCTVTMEAAKTVLATFKKRGGPKSDDVALEGESSTETDESGPISMDPGSTTETEAKQVGDEGTRTDTESRQ